MTMNKNVRMKLALPGLAIFVVALLMAVSPLLAQDDDPVEPLGSPIHPSYALLDIEGNSVVDTGNPVSTMQTCGQCHNTEFIAEHNAHGGILTGELTAPAGEALLVNSETGDVSVLQSAVADAEMNCFMCHSTHTNNDVRLEVLAAENFAWANTATLVGTGVVEQVGNTFEWNEDAFDEDGVLRPGYFGLQDPVTEACAQCHGVATSDVLTPLDIFTCGTEQRTTITTGQIFSPQRISDSGLNIVDKDELSRSWDVHAERVVGCTDCHYSLNNPAYATEPDISRPEHLIYDPRGLEPGEYIERPLHEFARSSADDINDHSCSSCHDASVTHDWLPYTERHMQELACETCHVPTLVAPARQTIDWTVLTGAGGPVNNCRGREMDAQGRILFTGYDPVWLPRETVGGTTEIAPYNVITTWYWIDGDGSPVELGTLYDVFYDGDVYTAEILDTFDANGDGELSSAELQIDSDDKVNAVAAQLAGHGVEDAEIVSQVEAYPIYHGVVNGEWAIRDCQTCHDENSRLAAPIVLTNDPPNGIEPTLPDDVAFSSGAVISGDDGTMLFKPETEGLYVFGYSAVPLVDWIGLGLLLAVMLGVFGHGGLRVLAAQRMASQHKQEEVKEVYMYGVYERFWHWLQTGVILLLILTGLVIHRPMMLGFLSFRGVVLMHNVLAVILIVNAVFALFYHIASGEIQQFLPKPQGFFSNMISQALYYLRGIFRGEPHPFEKTPERKLNPLQQITYLGLLNVLLPGQVITGALMWGAQRWPGIAEGLGGLPLLAPIHTLIAWLLATFVVMHVYLTTTGPTPLAGIRGMIFGWDEVEGHSSPEAASAD